MTKSIKALFFAILLLAAALGWWLGGSIPFEQQSHLLEGLRDSSAVVMAVLGIWLAVIFPEVLPKLFSGEAIHFDAAQLGRFRSVIYPLSLAALIVALEVVIPWAALVAKQLPFFVHHKATCRIASFGLLSALCLLQMFAILWMLIPVAVADMFAKSSSDKVGFIDEMNRGNKRKD
ncbi:hypothetical protein [Burkholderia pseudomallei]|uniref:hypothetical protein n=1 Tax=Burkholderia pseudomallei TaxID=28450 RepID=UPI0008FF1686|nr:hypothetical protein [Burkholderia pseudomallei]APD34046.1 hypothetical protein BK015_02015 [Burkholderia pseudomallei]ARL59372.1 hypothetical protein BOC52_23000 [Burkholderia pseudomallei]ARL65790.1 hypothetical protein BOC53_20090 [Burkholderia pseudomallei]NRD84599.1 hypothetical protein [Burkholderia pseudomallei]